MSPAFPRMMHICFHIRDDVDFNKFIADLEAGVARRGMTQVRANRVDHGDAPSRSGSAAPIERQHATGSREGKSNGWTLIYCKGPEGEQLEFVQALGPVKRTLRRRARGAPTNGGRFGPLAFAGGRAVQALSSPRKVLPRALKPERHGGARSSP